jgi:hypothetical protein
MFSATGSTVVVMRTVFTVFFGFFLGMEVLYRSKVP